MEISVIIPAFNEEEIIRFVIDRIPSKGIYEIIVIDGGSGDQTVEIAEACGATVLHEHRRGYGRACATGVAHASGKIVVFLDADGADDPKKIPELINPILDGQAEMVLGSRILGKIHAGAMPWHQYFGNRLSAGLIHLLYNFPITDLSPFRAVDRGKLLLLEMQEMTYGWPTEMITKAVGKNWNIFEIPVNYYPRYGGTSKISGTIRGTILATYYILSTILKYAR